MIRHTVPASWETKARKRITRPALAKLIEAWVTLARPCQDRSKKRNWLAMWSVVFCMYKNLGSIPGPSTTKKKLKRKKIKIESCSSSIGLCLFPCPESVFIGQVYQHSHVRLYYPQQQMEQLRNWDSTIWRAKSWQCILWARDQACWPLHTVAIVCLCGGGWGV